MAPHSLALQPATKLPVSITCGCYPRWLPTLPSRSASGPSGSAFPVVCRSGSMPLQSPHGSARLGARRGRCQRSHSRVARAPRPRGGALGAREISRVQSAPGCSAQRAWRGQRRSYCCTSGPHALLRTCWGNALNPAPRSEPPVWRVRPPQLERVSAPRRPGARYGIR